MTLLSRRQVFHGTAGAAVLAALPTIGRADAYPSRPIRLVIPFAAGGSNDQIGRPWADKMGPLLGSVVIENIGGAGGAIGVSTVARAAPDGYTLLLGNIGNQVLIPLASTHASYDSLRDFRGVYRLVTGALAFAVHPSLPVHNLRELIAYAKANPGKLSYGSAGAGTSNQLVGEMFKLQSGTPDIVHVPYRGAGPATSDLIGGQILLIVAVMSGQLLQLHQAGKLRILAVTSAKRLVGAPDIPTAVESGMPDLLLEGWFGIFAPQATPEPIVERIAQATRVAMTDPGLVETYRAAGMEADVDSSPQKIHRLVEEEVVRLAPLIKSIGLKID
jgi:tripartite-type tricarboxylate transporter receptor subunit TctC